MTKGEAKGQAGKEFIAFEEHVLQSQPWLSERNIQNCFLTSIFRFVFLVILQNPSK